MSKATQLVSQWGHFITDLIRRNACCIFFISLGGTQGYRLLCNIVQICVYEYCKYLYTPTTTRLSSLTPRACWAWSVLCALVTVTLSVDYVCKSSHRIDVWVISQVVCMSRLTRCVWVVSHIMCMSYLACYVYELSHKLFVCVVSLTGYVCVISQAMCVSSHRLCAGVVLHAVWMNCLTCCIHVQVVSFCVWSHLSCYVYELSHILCLSCLTGCELSNMLCVWVV